MNDEQFRKLNSGQQALTAQQANKLLSVIPRLDHELLITLAITTGIRRADIVAIERSNIDLEHATLRFYQNKKSNWHTVPLSPAVVQLIQKHLYTAPKSRWLFPASNIKNHICSKTAYNHFQNYLDAAGIKQRPFHSLRATCIKLSQQKGWTIEQVMALTDDSFRTIKEHYDTPSDEEMQEAAKTKSII
jgi:integrase